MLWLVTDHADTRDALSSLLGGAGYRVTPLDCGDEVVKRIRFQTPALIIIDCALADAFEIIGRTRSAAPTLAVPIILFTTADEDLRDQAILKGADAYVPKGSLDWAELLAEVARYAGPPSRA